MSDFSGGLVLNKAPYFLQLWVGWGSAQLLLKSLRVAYRKIIFNISWGASSPNRFIALNFFL